MGPFLRSLLIIAALGAAYFSSAPAYAQSADSVQALIEEALRLFSVNKYADANAAASHALAAAEAEFGPDHPDVAPTLAVLAKMYQAQGKYDDTERALKRLLAIQEKALGPDQEKVLAVQDKLGMLYRIEHRYGEAETFLRKSLVSREQTSGPHQDDICQSLDKLAALHQSQDRFNDAEPEIKRCLAARERMLGPNHPDVGQSLHELARLYRSEGRRTEAEPIYRRGVALLGANHPEAILAAIRAGEYDKAAGAMRLNIRGDDREALIGAVRKTFFGQVTDLRWSGYRSNIVGASGSLTIEGEATHGNGLWQPFAVQMMRENGEWKLGEMALLGLAWR